MAIHNIIRDDGVQFQIVPNTRKVIVPSSHRAIGTVGSHNSEQVVFKCPKMIDGHDVSACSEHFVDWVNARGNDGSYKIKKADITTDSEYMYLPWKIDLGVTAAAGNIEFAVHFEDKDEITGVLNYAWGTAKCEECQILDTVKSRSGSTVPVPPGYVKPKDTLPIVKNGNYNVIPFAEVDVKVPEPSEVKHITANGTYDEDDGIPMCAKLIVEVPSEIEAGYIKPEGVKEIKENGNNIDVAAFAKVNVAVPNTIPDDYVKIVADTFPDVIDENGTYIVTNYRKVIVSVPNTIPDDYVKIVADTFPDVIEESGTYNVANYREVVVRVPQSSVEIPDNYYYLAPDSTKTIEVTQSGTAINVAELGVSKIIINTPESESHPTGVFSIDGNYLIENNGKTISLADLIAAGYGSLYIALEEAGNDGEA